MKRDRLSASGRRVAALWSGGRRFLSLPWPEQRLSVEALLVLVRVAARMKMPGWRSAMRRRPLPVRHLRTPRATDLAKARALHLALLRASRVLGIGTCLSRSIALRDMLDRRGIASEIRVGTRRAGQESLEAHAWVELAGGVAMGADAPAGYRPLGTLAPGPISVRP